MSVISLIFDSIITSIFSGLWIVGWIFYINHSTGIYSNLSELTRDVYILNRLLNRHLNTDNDTDNEEKILKLEEQVEKLSKKVSKVKNMYIALSENIASLNDRVIDIEDELDEDYKEDDQQDNSDEDNSDEDNSDEDSNLSTDDTDLLNKKYKHTKNKNKIE